jgi:hypothetical protein
LRLTVLDKTLGLSFFIFADMNMKKEGSKRVSQREREQAKMRYKLRNGLWVVTWLAPV